MEKELQDAFRKLKQRDVDTFPVEVISVQKEAGVCTVKDDELEYTKVRLSSVIDGTGKAFFLFPKIGSSVLVSPINEDLKQLYVEAYSEIESLDLKIGNVQFEIDQEGFLLKKENESLKKVMADLIAAIKAMRFTTNAGPTIKLINREQFTQLENRFNNLLK
ncbi:hypothetical protein [Flavobacterium sp. UBA4197]|uniref:hypothetical protein n=1 Tax=Flavobacterium sp. UBA4197 TaxID=1946546 RepID=UPI0025796E08|nr:hypothetical protein [Flavobacterium sp. UBA4197]